MREVPLILPNCIIYLIVGKFEVGSIYEEQEEQEWVARDGEEKGYKVTEGKTLRLHPFSKVVILYTR
jgi:hypothetical protein